MFPNLPTHRTVVSYHFASFATSLQLREQRENHQAGVSWHQRAQANDSRIASCCRFQWFHDRAKETTNPSYGHRLFSAVNLASRSVDDESPLRIHRQDVTVAPPFEASYLLYGKQVPNLLKFTPNGKYLLAGLRNRLGVWNTQSGKRERLLFFYGATDVVSPAGSYFMQLPLR